jgi:hypothetical protein
MVEQTVRENRSVIERYGLAIVVFILFWLALGLGIALLGAALVIGFELILRAVAGPSGDEATETSFERSTGDGGSPLAAPAPDEVTSTYAAPAAVDPVTVVAPAIAVDESPPIAETPAAKTPTTKAKIPAKSRAKQPPQSPPKPPTT